MPHGPASCSTESPDHTALLSPHGPAPRSTESLDWATRPIPQGPASCSTAPLDTAHDVSLLPDWATRQMPRGPASCSTVNTAHDASQALSAHSSHGAIPELDAAMDDWLQENFPDSVSTQAQADDAFSITPSVYARLAAEPTAARNATAIKPEHLHFIRTCHGGAAGHHGRDETIRKLQRAGLSWPTRFVDVARYIASCPTCQRFRLRNKVPYAMYKTIFTHAPLFGRWHADFLTIKRPCTFTAATKVLVMEEERSRYVMLHACKAETSIEAVIAFLNTFSIFGIPESIRSDKAANLISAAVKDFLELTGIRHDFSIPHQPHSNGIIERTCGETGRLLRMLCCDLHAYGRWSLMLPLVQRQLNSLTRSTIGCSANQLLFGPRVNLDRYIIPTAPMHVPDETRAAVAAADTVQSFTDTLLIAQQDIMDKADKIRIKLLNDNTRRKPFAPDSTPAIGQTVLVPWNATHTRPEKLSANYMGPYVIVRYDHMSGSAALAHTIVPTPHGEPRTCISAISELLLFDDSLAIAEYDVPEDRFRQLAYHENQTRAIACILAYRPRAIITADPITDVTNYEYEVRFSDSKSLTDTAWLPYSAVLHTFAFESFYPCIARNITGHRGTAIPAEHRHVHQSRASAASARRRRSLSAPPIPPSSSASISIASSHPAVDDS